MSKDMIYKMVFEEIKESIDWGLDSKDGSYSHYIDGVICLGMRMLKELDKSNVCPESYLEKAMNK